MKDLLYWERLAILNMSSIQRRHERYKIIYCWKALWDMVPNFGISIKPNSTKGTILTIPDPKCDVQAIYTLRNNSLKVEGPKLFNSLPPQIRNYVGTKEGFKKTLDTFLTKLPDHPKGHSQEESPRAKDSLGRDSNSIKDWIYTLKHDNIYLLPQNQILRDCYTKGLSP